MFRAFSFAAAASSTARASYLDGGFPLASRLEVEERSVSPTNGPSFQYLPILPPPAMSHDTIEVDVSHRHESRTSLANLVQRFQDYSISSPHLAPSSSPFYVNCTPFPSYDDFDETLGMDDDRSLSPPSITLDNTTTTTNQHHSERDSVLMDSDDLSQTSPCSSASLRQRRQALHYDAAQLRDITLLIRQMVDSGDQCSFCSPRSSFSSPASSSYASCGESENGDFDDPMRLFPDPAYTGLRSDRPVELRYRRSADCVDPARRVVKQVRQRKKKRVGPKGGVVKR